ncbi:AsmA family protein [Geomonas sp. Red276]
MMALLLFFLVVLAALAVYLASPFPAAHLSRLVRSQLHQDFTISSLHLEGGSIVLVKVRLDNPPGFPSRPLLAADRVLIAPNWGELIRGNQRFRQIVIDGVTADLEKDPAGNWNFANLQRYLASRKPSPKETVIGELAIHGGSLQVQGEGMDGISLSVRNVATKGSGSSTVDLAFEDPAHNAYLLKGTARAGAEPAVDLSLTAPSLSLPETAAWLKMKNAQLLKGGRGSLQVNATLQRSVLAAVGDLRLSGIRPPVKGAQPVNGALHISAGYDAPKDSFHLSEATLSLSTLLRLHAKGTVDGLKGRRAYAFSVAMDEVDLAALTLLVPNLDLKGMEVGGRLRCDSLTLEGERSGLANLTGLLTLRDGTLSRGDRLLAEGVNGSVNFARQKGGIATAAEFSVTGNHPAALVSALKLPLKATLSPKFKPVRAEASPFSATVSGIPVTGRLSFDAGAARPLAANLNFPATRIANLNELLGRYGIKADGGTASLDAQLSGRGANDFEATARLAVHDLRGQSGKRTIGVGTGAVTLALSRAAGKLSADGNADLGRLAIDTTAGDARFHFQFANQVLTLQDAQAELAGLKLAIRQLTATVPRGAPVDKGKRYPLQGEFSGVSVTRGDWDVSEMAGTVKGSYFTAGVGRWLEGGADVSTGGVNFKGKRLGAPALHATFARSGASITAGGDLLGGRLTGSVALDPFAPAAGTGFDLAVAKARVVDALQWSSPAGSSPTRPSAGTVDLRCKGHYSTSDGLAGSFESAGEGIALSGAAGKTLLSGAALTLSGSLAKGDLTVREGTLSLGPACKVTASGQVNQVFKPERRGRITATLPRTQVNGVIDPLVNLLPRSLQEGTLGGSLSAAAEIAFAKGAKLLQGTVTVDHGSFDVPAQKLSLGEINGSIPFSLDLSGGGTMRPPEVTAYNRENYPRLFPLLAADPGRGETFTIGKLSLGSVRMGALSMRLVAEKGVTEITKFQTTLFQGTLVGKGYLTLSNRLLFRTDLLISDLSLKTLCSMFPAITGYISGRVDGVVSLSGKGGNLAGITGFTDLWARKGGGEKMLVSKEFLQKLAKQKLSGFFFRSDRDYDRAEIKAMLQQGDLSFESLIIEHTNMVGVRDLSVSIAPEQNRIALDHLFDSIKEAAVRGKGGAAKQPEASTPAPAPAAAPETPEAAPPATEFKWGE